MPNPDLTDFIIGEIPAVKKIVVAVHGIGDQVRNETILATAVRFCDFYGYEGVLALGAFHPYPPPPPPPPGKPPPPPAEPALFINDPLPFQPRAGLTNVLGFVEVHWADTARAISEEKYTLQESKAWARSIVNRIRVFAGQRRSAQANIDYRRIGFVLEEIIDTIHVIEVLLFLSRKAGLGELDLKKLLDAYLGDVQLVTEFSQVREAIVQKFTWVMSAIRAKYPGAEIHVIAHSEGTVVSFLGLLEACDNPAKHPWINQVRGFVTLGSPIDKHLILWPGLFDRHKGPDRNARARIRWANYVDYGDPIGFDLDTARLWLEQRGYAQVLQFKAEDDFSFRRYPVPGKAHNDYWRDQEVFGHFIQKIVDPRDRSPDEEKQPDKGPPSLWWIRLVSHGVGYLVPLLLLHLGVYVLCQAIYGYLDPKDQVKHPDFIRTVLALSWLVAGTTVWLRIIRLTRSWGWFFAGMGIYALFVLGYAGLIFWMKDEPVTGLQWFETYAAASGWPLGAGCFAASLLLIALVYLVNLGFWRRMLGKIFA